MREPFKVLQLGFGAIGKTIAKGILERENLELVGLVDIDPVFQNQQVEKLLSLSSKSSTIIRSNLQETLNELHNQQVDVALVLTSSSLEIVAPTIFSCLHAALDVVSLCEELSYPFVRHPQLTQDLNQLAHEVGKTVLGTGINPGYLMDLLPIVLTAPCQSVDRICITRQMNSSNRRDSFQEKIGTGMTQEDFKYAVAKKTITGHVGLVESIHMIDTALELNLDHVEEFLPEPIIASEETVTSFTTVRKGGVLGLKSKAIGSQNGEELIKLDFVAFAGASPEYDEIEIMGHPNICQRIEGGVHGDLGTVAMVLNMIPLVVEAQPGLLTMNDIPCARNTQRVWKRSR